MKWDCFEVTFWGCQGSSAYAPSKRQRFGTNTPCVSVQCGQCFLVFDAGTGIIDFSQNHLLAGYYASEINLFLSHYHLGHIEGIPHAKIFSDRQTFVNIYGKMAGLKNTHDILRQLFSPPFYPYDFMMENADRYAFYNLTDYQTYSFNDGVTVKMVPVTHPGGSNAFKVSYGGKSFCYLSDYEYDGDFDGRLKDLIEGADLVAFDAHTNSAYYQKDYGHSTWEQAAILAKHHNVSKMALFHYAPFVADADLMLTQQLLDQIPSNTFFIEEGAQIDLLADSET